MKLEFIPGSHRMQKSEPYTTEWAVWLVKKMGSPTVREMKRSNSDFRRYPEEAEMAFKKACDEGLLEYHNANHGKRGKPRLEFRIPKK